MRVNCCLHGLVHHYLRSLIKLTILERVRFPDHDLYQYGEGPGSRNVWLQNGGQSRPDSTRRFVLPGGAKRRTVTH